MRVSSAQMPTDDMWQLAPDASTALIASTQPSNDRGAVIDVLRVGGVGRVQFRRHRELAAPQHALKPPARRMAGQRLERQIGAGRIFVAMGHDASAFRASAACAVTRSHAEVSRSEWSTGGCSARIASPPCICRLPLQACTQTQGMSGSTSQWPLARTPPHGPFRSRFGQFIGHDMPVEERMHWPHMRQSKSRPFTRRSTNFTGASARE